MKTKAILATLLVAAAASADARFASPFPRKAVPPDEIGHWIVINGNPWSHDVESELDRRKIVAERSSWCRAQESRKDFTLCEMSIFESLRKK